MQSGSRKQEVKDRKRVREAAFATSLALSLLSFVSFSLSHVRISQQLSQKEEGGQLLRILCFLFEAPRHRSLLKPVVQHLSCI